METHFAALTRKQSMLLLAAVIFGGPAVSDALALLPEEEARLLRDRAEGLLQIPRETRIPLLVKEMRRMLAARGAALGWADPARLTQALAAERPGVVETLLRGLPGAVAEEVRRRGDFGPLGKRRELKPEVAALVRSHVEEVIRSHGLKPPRLVFSDLLLLKGREVMALCDRMGARVLALAFAGLPDDERDALLEKLSPDQAALGRRAAEGAGERRLSEDDARALLESFGVPDAPSRGFRSAGAQRVVRAALAESMACVEQLMNQHGGELGALLSEWYQQEVLRTARGDGGRADIVEQMERLAQRDQLERPVRAIQGTRSATPREQGARRASSQDVGKKTGPLSSERPAVPLERPVSSAVAQPAVPPAQVPLGEEPPAPRRDAIADRVARREGAAAARVPVRRRIGKPENE